MGSARFITQMTTLSLFCLFAACASAAETCEYDDLDRLTLVTYEDGSSVAFEYDPAGNVLSRTVPEPDVGSGVIRAESARRVRSDRGAVRAVVKRATRAGVDRPEASSREG